MSPSISKPFEAATAKNPAKSRKRKRPSPFPLRLSPDERTWLERKAGSRSLGAYIRDKALAGYGGPGTKSARAPSIDYALLGQVLGLLGKSELSTRLCLLAVAAEAGKLELAKQDHAALRNACHDVREMRALLIKALGLKSGDTP